MRPLYLYLSLGVLSILILSGIVLVLTYLRVRSMERELRQFFRDLERRPKAEIISIIKGRPRSG
jgi:hypothetical protein